MFVGRDYELNSLNKLYEENKFQLAVIYGRRRVGKTTLIKEFCKDKPNIFYVAEEYNDKIALENFSDKILTHFDMKAYISSFESWEKAFMYLGKQSKEERLIVVLDEFPYIVNSNKSIPSLLQNLIDHYLKDTKLFLIICGSSMSFIEREVLSYKSPLYGRRTAQYIIDPFDFFDSSKFFPKYNLEDCVKAYGILGGIPQYLSKFTDESNIQENIKRYILNKSSYLYEEPKNLLKQELREPALYNSIIEAIANGSTKLNEIATKVGENTDKCAKYIKTLLELRILRKETPAGEEGISRKSIYRLQDNLFKFWYRFVFDNVSLIEQEMIDHVYGEKIQPELSNYLGAVFEDICTEYLKRKNKKMELPFVFDKIGRWWGNNPIKKREEEIDILAINKQNALFGECKWTNSPVDMGVVNSLIEKSSILNYSQKYYIFFSKSGYTEEVRRLAGAGNNMFLIELMDFGKGWV